MRLRQIVQFSVNEGAPLVRRPPPEIHGNGLTPAGDAAKIFSRSDGDHRALKLSYFRRFWRVDLKVVLLHLQRRGPR